MANVIPDRKHIEFYRSIWRGADPKWLQNKRAEWEQIKKDAPRDCAKHGFPPEDSIIICNAAIIAINELLQVARYGDRRGIR